MIYGVIPDDLKCWEPFWQRFILGYKAYVIEENGESVVSLREGRMVGGTGKQRQTACFK